MAVGKWPVLTPTGRRTNLNQAAIGELIKAVEHAARAMRAPEPAAPVDSATELLLHLGIQLDDDSLVP